MDFENLHYNEEFGIITLSIDGKDYSYDLPLLLTGESFSLEVVKRLLTPKQQQVVLGGIDSVAKRLMQNDIGGHKLGFDLSLKINKAQIVKDLGMKYTNFRMNLSSAKARLLEALTLV